MSSTARSHRGSGNGAGLDGIADLRTVMPDFRQLTPDVEPRGRLLIACPRDRESRRLVQRRALEVVRQVAGDVRIQIDKDAGA